MTKSVSLSAAVNLSGILKASSGSITTATPGTDYIVGSSAATFTAGVAFSISNGYSIASTINGTTTGFAVWGLSNNPNGVAGYFATGAPNGYGLALETNGPSSFHGVGSSAGTLGVDNIDDGTHACYCVASTCNYSGGGTAPGYAIWGKSNSPYGYGGYFASTASIGYGYALGVSGQAVFSNGTTTFNGPVVINGGISIAGSSQTWQDVHASRVAATPYTNSTGLPIFVAVALATSAPCEIQVTVGGITWNGSSAYSSGLINAAQFIVPAGATYQVANNGGTSVVSTWAELR